MTDSNSAAAPLPRIDHPVFQQAVDHLDAGELDALQLLLQRESWLLSHRAAEDGSRVGAYFARPYLLCFVAENPIRQGSMPKNIVEITKLILEEATRQELKSLQEQMNFCLSLVASGKVAREEQQQQPLIELLCSYGADANAAMDAALAEGEGTAVELLLAQGADRSLAVLVLLNDEAALKLLLQEEPCPSEADVQKALMVAALQGRAEMISLLCSSEAGNTQPSFYAPEGFHRHSSPLHQAAYYGHGDTVKALLQHGADPLALDTIWGGTPRDWAEYGGHPELIPLLEAASSSGE